MDIQGLYSTLLTASFGGVPFYVIDTSQEVGRRMLRFLYPGIDEASYQDLGADDGPIALRGLLAGDDYIAQSRSLRAVFRSPGPYSLVHPWLGNFQVVLVENSRPKITLSATELRIARFELQLYPFNPTAQPGLDTLSKLDARLDALKADAQSWLANAMSPIVGLLGAFGFVQGFLTSTAGIFTGALGAAGASAGEIYGALAGDLALLALPTAAPSPSWAADTAAQLAAVPAAISGAAAPLVPSAVAPGGASVAAAAAAPQDTINMLLAALPGIAATGSGPSPAPALAGAMQALTVAAIVTVNAGVAFPSAQAAAAQAGIIYTAIDGAILAAAAAAASDPANAAPVWRDLTDLKAALAADLNSLIGRLPEVVVINLPVAMPAWLLAEYIAGDNPADIYPTYQDIIARNNVANPASVPAGPVEVLNQ